MLNCDKGCYHSIYWLLDKGGLKTIFAYKWRVKLVRKILFPLPQHYCYTLLKRLRLIKNMHLFHLTPTHKPHLHICSNPCNKHINRDVCHQRNCTTIVHTYVLIVFSSAPCNASVHPMYWLGLGQVGVGGRSGGGGGVEGLGDEAFL